MTLFTEITRDNLKRISEMLKEGEPQERIALQQVGALLGSLGYWEIERMSDLKEVSDELVKCKDDLVRVRARLLRLSQRAKS